MRLKVRSPQRLQRISHICLHRPHHLPTILVAFKTSEIPILSLRKVSISSLKSILFTIAHISPIYSRHITEAWDATEDEILTSLVERFGTQTWTEIAQRLPNRSGKQCRERWHNHLDPGIRKVSVLTSIFVRSFYHLALFIILIGRVVRGRRQNHCPNATDLRKPMGQGTWTFFITLKFYLFSDQYSSL